MDGPRSDADWHLMCRARLRRGKPVDSPEVFKETDAVRARPRRLSALSVLHSQSVLHGAFRMGTQGA